MSTNRRKFLKIGTLAAFAAAMPVKASNIAGLEASVNNLFDRSHEFPRNGLGDYSRAAFASCLNTVFRVYVGHKTVNVKLAEIDDAGPNQEGECFSLRFTGAHLALPQNSYGVDHPKLGSFPLFLVPAGKDSDTHDFVAIVNRLYNHDPRKQFPTAVARLKRSAKP